MTEQISLWQGPFGDFYQERNKLTDEEINKRLIFLEGIIRVIYGHTGQTPKSVYELGAGQGPNMAAFEKLSTKLSIPMKLYASEINQKARLALSENCKTVEILPDIPPEPVADLVMTYGVLIHTHPAHLRKLIEKLYNASNKWILCVEYFAPETRPVTYRGEKDALWLDDYGSKWVDNHPLMVLGYGFQWKKTTGMDNVTFWLMEKKNVGNPA